MVSLVNTDILTVLTKLLLIVVVVVEDHPAPDLDLHVNILFITSLHINYIFINHVILDTVITLHHITISLLTTLFSLKPYF